MISVERWGHISRRVKSEEIDGNEHGKLFETFSYKAEQNNEEGNVEWYEKKCVRWGK